MTPPDRWALGVFSASPASPFLGEAAIHESPGLFTGLVVGDRVRDLSSDAALLGIQAATLQTQHGTRALLENWAASFAALDALATETGTGTWLTADAVAAHAPLAPGQVLQAGANYRKHVIDLAVSHADIANGRTEQQVRDETAEMMDARTKTGIPYFFIGLPSAITGPNDDVCLPGYSDKHDWELELAAVIGTPAFRVSPEEALEHVAAYTIVNDLTTRDLVFRRDMPEIGTDWFRSKNAPGFLPVGPWLVPSAFVGDPQQLHLTLRLNGTAMQDEEASDMLFTVAQLVSAASQTVVLRPADLILTGSPAGNGAAWGRLLRDGDVMESTITGLGSQRTRVYSEQNEAAAAGSATQSAARSAAAEGARR